MVNGSNNDHEHREGSRGTDEENAARSELNNADSIYQMYVSFIPFMRRIVSASVRESLSLFTSIKGIVLIILVAQSCIGLLLTRYTRARPVVPETGDPPLFSVPSAVMCTEAIKLFVCFWWVFCTEFPTSSLVSVSATSGKHSNSGSVVGSSEGTCGGTRRDRGVSPTGPAISSVSTESTADAHTPKNNSNNSNNNGLLSRLAQIIASPRRFYAQCVFVLRSALLHRDAWHMLPPALLFTFQSNIIYVALQNVEVTLFQVLYQSKLLLTALFVGYAFKRSFNRMQWISLFCLFIGVVVSQLGSAGNSSGKGGSPSKLQTNRGGGEKSGGGSNRAAKQKQNDASLLNSGILEISTTAADENSRGFKQAHQTLGINHQDGDAADPVTIVSPKVGQTASVVESAYIPTAVEEPKEKEGPVAIVGKDCTDSGDVCVGKSANAQKEQAIGSEHQDGDKDHSSNEKQKVRANQAASFPVEFSSGRKLLSGDENGDEKVEPDAVLANKNNGKKTTTGAKEDEDEKIEVPSSTTGASESLPARQKSKKKGSRKKKEATASASSNSSSSLIGIVALLASSVSSAIAAVVMEKVLKDASSPQSLAVRNVQLAIFSLGLTGIVHYYNTLSKAAGMSTATVASREGSGGLTASSYLASSNTWDRPYPPPLLYDVFGEFFLGFDAYVWALVVNQAVGGILVALVLKYADNILKGFAVAVCIFICGLFSWLVWDTHLAPGFVLGATIVTFSVVTYSVASSKGA